MPKNYQVLTLAHPLPEGTKRYLRQLYPQAEGKVFHKVLHVQNFSKVVHDVEKLFEELKKEGLDVSGRTPTYFVAPSSSTVAMTVCMVWHGLTGSLPSVLNHIRCGSENHSYKPSPELPIIFGDSVSQSVRGKRVTPQGTNQVHVTKI